MLEPIYHISVISLFSSPPVCSHLPVQVRDARIIASTSHPQVPTWVGPKPRLLVINRSDSIQPEERRKWDAYFKQV